MSYSLVNWVNSWFYNPGTIQTPKEDRVACYVAAVLLIGDHIHTIQNKTNEKNLHDLLTYLLLGWNPITAWPKSSEFDESSTNEIPDWDLITETFKQLMNFTKKDYRHHMFRMFCCFSNTAIKHQKHELSRFSGERLTMLILSMWLLHRKTAVPADDVGLVRLCLDLYYTSEKIPAEGALPEYAFRSHDLDYVFWMRKSIDYLLMLDISSEVLTTRLAYLAWFASLVRAGRIVRCIGRNVEWRVEIDAVLKDEVTKLLGVLASQSLRIDEGGPRRDSKLKDRLFRLFRIKPPPVKIQIKSVE